METPDILPGLVAPPPAYRALCRRLGLEQGIPWTEHWSAEADFLERILAHCLEQRPPLILECSSGLTTLVLARACRLNGRGRVVSLEDGAGYADASRRALAHYGLAQWGRVLHAPLRTWRVNGREFLWYTLEQLPQAPVEMLVIDGPSGFIQAHSRYPALPLLRERIAPGCAIFLDDAARPQERETVAMWMEQVPGLSHEYLATQRGCSLLRTPPAGPAEEQSAP